MEKSELENVYLCEAARAHIKNLDRDIDRLEEKALSLNEQKRSVDRDLELQRTRRSILSQYLSKNEPPYKKENAQSHEVAREFKVRE